MIRNTFEYIILLYKTKDAVMNNEILNVDPKIIKEMKERLEKQKQANYIFFLMFILSKQGK